MPVPPPNPDKIALRRALRQARANIPENVRRNAGHRIRRLALHHGLLNPKRRFGFYMPSKGEVDCLPLLNQALTLGVRCYLPIVPHRRQRKLWFSLLGDGPHWRENRFGILEYGHRFAKVRAARLDILFLPLLGFDARGYRMGMGGGFYDATLAFLRQRTHWQRPFLIGMAFEAQKVAFIPSDPWDVPLDAVMTERRFYRFRRRGQ